MRLKRYITAAALLIASAGAALADGTKDDIEVLTKFRFGVDAQIKLAKGLKLDLEPEFRFNEGYEKLSLSAGVSYKTFGFIYWGATYRLDVNREESGSYNTGFFGSNEYESKAYHRYAFDVTFKEKFHRFTPSFRLRYNNFTDEDIDDKAYMRYRAKVEYNIRKCKFTPSLSIEAYQKLGTSGVFKTRYGAGVELKTGKNSALSFDYKFDLYALEYKNANIFSLGYKFKL